MKKHRIILVVTATALILLLLIMLFIVYIPASNIYLIKTLALSGFVIVLLYLLFFLFRIYHPLSTLRKKMSWLAAGEIKEFDLKKIDDEFCTLEANLNLHLKNLNTLIRILNKLADGEYPEDINSFSQNNELGKALNKLKESIEAASSEAGKRRQEDERQNWSSQGIAHFGELLRSNESDLATLANCFIKELTAYCDLEVGGIYLRRHENNDICYKLYGAWAFDREKSLSDSYLPGEGLVGRCALEKEQILITDVPEDYIRIRSGLGEDQPSTIILQPVLIDKEVIAIIELAGFSTIPGYKLNFLKSLSHSIAASLARVLG